MSKEVSLALRCSALLPLNFLTLLCHLKCFSEEPEVINMQNRYHHLFKVFLKAVKQRIQTNKTEMFYSAIFSASRY